MKVRRWFSLLDAALEVMFWLCMGAGAFIVVSTVWVLVANEDPPWVTKIAKP